jgi:hypothetical protein
MAQTTHRLELNTMLLRAAQIALLENGGGYLPHGVPQNRGAPRLYAKAEASNDRPSAVDDTRLILYMRRKFVALPPSDRLNHMIIMIPLLWDLL